MEFAEGGDLLKKVENHKRCKTSFSESEVLKMFVQMVAGLKALHDQKIYHRDIKVSHTII
jgi:serine/threonine protein kinase